MVISDFNWKLWNLKLTDPQFLLTLDSEPISLSPGLYWFENFPSNTRFVLIISCEIILVMIIGILKNITVANPVRDYDYYYAQFGLKISKSNGVFIRL